MVDNGATFVTSNAFILTVDPKIQSFSVPASVNQGDGVTLEAKVRTSVDVTYRWYRNSAQITSGSLVTISGSLATISAASAVDAGTYKAEVLVGGSVVATTASKSMAVVSPVAITAQPTVAASVGEGTPLSLSVTATGGSLSYEWSKDGTVVSNGSLISGATSSVLRIGTLRVSDSGVYQVRVANAFSFALSNPVTVNVAQKLGVTLPANVSVKSGEGVSLVPTVTGSDATTTFQWQKNGKAVSGSTADQYRINAATDADEAVYTLVATKGGVTASASVSVAVLKLPEILAGPVSRTVLGSGGLASSSVVFSVAARSNTTLRYKWTKDGSLVSIGTAATLRLTSATAGTYTVTLTNDVGSVTRSATLTLSTNPSDLATHHAGSTNGTSDTRGNVYSNWWVYSVDLADSQGAMQGTGYWLQERTLQSGTVTPGKSAWIIKPTSPATIFSGTLHSDSWTLAEQTVQDSVDSGGMKTFSVVAYRTDSESFTIAGRVESAGAAAYYGAPDAMSGDYAQGDVELEWNTDKVDILQSNSDFESAVTQLKAYLEVESASTPGE